MSIQKDQTGKMHEKTAWVEREGVVVRVTDRLLPELTWNKASMQSDSQSGILTVEYKIKTLLLIPNSVVLSPTNC